MSNSERTTRLLSLKEAVMLAQEVIKTYAEVDADHPENAHIKTDEELLARALLELNDNRASARSESTRSAEAQGDRYSNIEHRVERELARSNLSAAAAPSAETTVTVEDVDRALSEAANSCCQEEQYYLHGLWKAREIIRALKSAAPQVSTASLGADAGRDVGPLPAAAALTLSAEDIAEIRDQCVQGLRVEHDCPAVYALAAILADVGMPELDENVHAALHTLLTDDVDYADIEKEILGDAPYQNAAPQASAGRVDVNQATPGSPTGNAAAAPSETPRLDISQWRAFLEQHREQWNGSRAHALTFKELFELANEADVIIGQLERDLALAREAELRWEQMFYETAQSATSATERNGATASVPLTGETPMTKLIYSLHNWCNEEHGEDIIENAQERMSRAAEAISELERDLHAAGDGDTWEAAYRRANEALRKREADLALALDHVERDDKEIDQLHALVERWTKIADERAIEVADLQVAARSNPSAITPVSEEQRDALTKVLLDYHYNEDEGKWKLKRHSYFREHFVDVILDALTGSQS